MATPLREMVGTWEEIRAHDAELTGCRVRLTVLAANEEEKATETPEPKRRFSVRELLRLPLEERDRILEKQAAKAEVLYRTDSALMDFEAFGPDDLFDEYPAHDSLK